MDSGYLIFLWEDGLETIPFGANFTGNRPPAHILYRDGGYTACSDAYAYLCPNYYSHLRSSTRNL
jgi:hypothetical protein